MSLKVYDLTHTFTQFMPEWPSTPSVNISIDKFHAKDGVYQVSGKASCTAAPTWMHPFM